jgi:hypothetical protein
MLLEHRVQTLKQTALSNVASKTARTEYIVHTWVCKNQKRDSIVAK